MLVKTCYIEKQDDKTAPLDWAGVHMTRVSSDRFKSMKVWSALNIDAILTSL